MGICNPKTWGRPRSQHPASKRGWCKGSQGICCSCQCSVSRIGALTPGQGHVNATQPPSSSWPIPRGLETGLSPTLRSPGSSVSRLAGTPVERSSSIHDGSIPGVFPCLDSDRSPRDPRNHQGGAFQGKEHPGWNSCCSGWEAEGCSLFSSQLLLAPHLARQTQMVSATSWSLTLMPGLAP